MTVEKVEQVARAIWHASMNHPGITPEDYDANRPAWEKEARAAIAAMREPTEAMLVKVERDEGADREWAAIWWRAMIDAALKE